MAIVRFDPFRELTRLQQSLAGEGSWVPPVDIYEAADKALVIKAELPELRREAIAVMAEHGIPGSYPAAVVESLAYGGAAFNQYRGAWPLVDGGR